MISPTLLAVGVTATASLLVTINDALVKEALVSAGTAEVLFFRGLFALLPLIAFSLAGNRPETLLPRNIRLALLLSVLAVVSLFLFTISLRFIPLASAIVLAYLSPIMVALVSPLLIGERIGALQWMATLTGFVGVFVMTSPSLETRNWIILLPVLVAVIIAGRDILVRASIAHEHTTALVVWTHLLTIGAAACAFDTTWLRIDIRQFTLYAAAGITVSLGTAGMIAALRYASAASMSAVKYSCVLWAGLIGWLFFGERLSAGMITGGMLIVISGVTITWHEVRKGRDAEKIGTAV